MRRALTLGALTAVLIGLALAGSAIAGQEPTGSGGDEISIPQQGTNSSISDTCEECHPSGSPDFLSMSEGCSCHTGHGSLDPSKLRERSSKLSRERIHESHRDRSNPAAENSNCNSECHQNSDLSCMRCHQSHREPARNCTQCHGSFPHPGRHDETLEAGKHNWLDDCESCHDGEHVTQYKLSGVSEETVGSEKLGRVCLICHSAANRTHNETRLNGTSIDRCPACHDPHSPGEEKTQAQQAGDLLRKKPGDADVLLDVPDFSSFVRTQTGSIVSVVLLAILLAGVYEFSPESWKDTGPRQVYHQVVSIATESEDTLELRVSADRKAALLVLDYLEDQAVEVLASAMDSEDEQLTAVLDSPDISAESLEGQLAQIEGVEDVDVS